MTKVLDDAAIARAFRAAERRLAARDPDTLAGRFSPRPTAEEARQDEAARSAKRTASG